MSTDCQGWCRVGVTQLLGVPNTTGTERDQACCVVEVLTEWNSTDLVVALALDMISANTGHLSDACTVIDQTQKRSRLHGMSSPCD